MANITMEGDKTIKANKLHFYLREAGTELTTFTKTALDTILGGASYFANVESGFSLEEAEGDNIETTVGKIIILSKELSGEFNFLGATTADWDAMMEGADKYLNQDLDLFLINAEQGRTGGTVEENDEIYAVYSLNANIRMTVADNAPTKITISFKMKLGADNKAIKWNDVTV